MEEMQQKDELIAEISKLRKRIAELEVSEDERMHAEMALWEKEERYRTLLERIPLGIYRTTPAGEIVDANMAFVNILGYPDRNELIKVNVADLYADSNDREAYIRALEEQGVLQGDELRLKRKDGSIIWVRDFCRAVRNSSGKLLFHEGSIENITERKEIDTALAKAVSEKEALLRDLQHRVKNSLAMISGLIRLEMRDTSDGQSRTVLENLSNRIKSTANLYDILFHSGSTREVRLDQYIQNIVKDLSLAYISNRDTITIEQECERIVIDAKKGVPFGLIVNEVLTNMIKYAFPHNREGRIRVTLKGDQSSLKLTLADNGIGLPDGYRPEESTGMGMRLVLMMVEQLNGTYTLSGGNGVMFTVSVPL